MQRSHWQFVLSRLLLLGLLPGSCLPSLAGERAAPSGTPTIPSLHNLVTRSGSAFAGTVKTVEQIKPHHKDTVGVMRITFLVQKGYLGVRTGQVVTIHEWAGLWQAGERYRPGERVVLFLYPPSKLGLTSPMPNGRFPVDSGGQIVLPPPHQSPVISPNRGRLPGSAELPGSLRINLEDFEQALRWAKQE
jgi:hypothetical protein